MVRARGTKEMRDVGVHGGGGVVCNLDGGKSDGTTNVMARISRNSGRREPGWLWVIGNVQE